VSLAAALAAWAASLCAVCEAGVVLAGGGRAGLYCCGFRL
jgi:hypothetical protein